jgi:lipid A 4'-phosphatase
VRGAALYAGIFAATVAVFLAVPQLDLLASGLFYAPGHGFPLRGSEPAELLFRAVPWVAWGVAGIVFAAAAWLFLTGRPWWRFDAKALVFLAASFTIGPGLLANALLKDHWGRARPAEIEAFGGSQQFTAAPLPANECERNCSFVSGHAALGFSLVAFAFLLPPGRGRRAGIAAGLGVGALVGLDRIAQGAHFLSDVVFAGLVSYGTAALCHWWIIERDGLTAPMVQRFCRVAAHVPSSAGPFCRRVGATPAGRWVAAAVATAAVVLISLVLVDRPLALFLHARGPDLHALFEWTGRLGVAWGWLLLFGAAFAALHWGGDFPRLQAWARPMRRWSAVPAFLFATVAVSGLAADLLKIVFGRLRPKLLFGADLYGFGWFGWHADQWSFPSGHATTIAALMAALWVLWPRHLLFYILVGSIVAGSRVVVGAHYLSDIAAGAFVAVAATGGVAVLFARGGIDLRAGRVRVAEIPPWPCRCAVALWALRGRRRGLRRRRGV